MTDYWRARLDWNSALGTAQQYGIADSASFPSAENEDRFGLVDNWRAALVKQMLTPAPDQNAVNWKLAKLRGKHSTFNFPADVDSKRLRRAIEADVADVEWLKNHPSRKSIAATRQAEKGK